MSGTITLLPKNIYFVHKVKFNFASNQKMKSLKCHKEKDLFLKIKQATVFIKKETILTAGPSDLSD